MTVVTRRVRDAAQSVRSDYHEPSTATERSAALSQRGSKKEGDLKRVLQMVRDTDGYGLTAHEARSRWHVDCNTPASRLTNLKELGLVYTNGTTRPTNTGRPALVHYLTPEGEQAVRSWPL